MTSMLGMMGVEPDDKMKPSEQEEKDYQLIFDSIKKSLEKEGFHIKEEWFPDGYLISYDHKMWHFKLKECPDWLFGIWLDDYGEWTENQKLSNTSDKDYYQLQIFAQHENYIDKFKPTASTLLYKENIYKPEVEKDEKEINEKDSSYLRDERMKLFKYVRDYPAIAWYQDAHYTDLKFEYVSLEDAQKDFVKSEKERIRHEKDVENQHKEERQYIESLLKKEGCKYKIFYDEYCSPCFHLIIEDPEIEKEGWYSFLEDDEWEELEKIRAKHDKYNSWGFNNCAKFVKELK